MQRSTIIALVAACLASALPARGQQTVAGSLANMALRNTATLVQGSGNMLTSLTQPNVYEDGSLPKCQKTSVLLNAGSFPTNWAQLNADQQVAHPINLVMFQLGYVAYQPQDAFKDCLAPMGVDTSSIKLIERREAEFFSGVTAMVFKAANERIFVIFKGSDADNVMTDAACRYTEPLGAAFGAPGEDLRLHNGFYRAWQALEKDVVSTVQGYLKSVPSGKVYVIGHSLGASLAAIAALRLNTVLPKTAEVAGVWLLASPRVGNVVWRDNYNDALMSKTLRFNNYKDFAVRLPMQVQQCSTGGPVATMLVSETARYSYFHVGRALLMCPVASSGLTQWNIYPAGSERVECGVGKDGADTSGATHMLGSYFDAWRRGSLASKGSSLSNTPQVAAVMCQQCTFARLTRLLQANVPARAGGPVTCSSDASCQDKKAWEAATSFGKGFSASFGDWSVCNGFLCSDPGV